MYDAPFLPEENGTSTIPFRTIVAMMAWSVQEGLATDSVWLGKDR
jgi:hypothetical protein